MTTHHGQIALEEVFLNKDVTVSKDYDALTIQIVNELFRILFSIKPAFKNSFETQDDLLSCKRQWMSAFEENNIKSIEKLQRAVKHFRSSPSPFFPSPGEFMEMCKANASDVGAPNTEPAYQEAIKQSHRMIYEGLYAPWSHACVENAYHRCDKTILKTSSHAKSLEHFRQNYEIAIHLFSEGMIMAQIQNMNRFADYQEYVGRIKSDMRCKLINKGTKILSFEEWRDQ